MDGFGGRACAKLASFVALLIIGVLAFAGSASAAPAFTRAFTDPIYSEPGGAQWVPQIVATGARLVLVGVNWSSIEPTAPAPGGDPTNPAGIQYDFTSLDQTVREFAGTGVSVAFSVSDAPSWAEAPGGPQLSEDDGAWKPNVQAYGQFATALARRYSGSFPDPLNPGHSLPSVRYYQAWAEANLGLRLGPQWTRTRGKWVAVGPVLYRSLLNSFYAAVKGVRARDTIITTGFAPYGDPPGGQRIPPAAFLRDLLCLHGENLSRQACAGPTHFDVLAADPYQVASPTTPALNADDVSTPDLWKLTRILNRALRVGTALPRTHKPLWVTEFSYDSNPPNPYGVSAATQARWLEESLYVFWSEGVSTCVWYLLRDSGGTDWANSYYSGVYFYNGQRKPSFYAFRFPFVVMPSGRSATVWGIAPQTGTVTVEHKAGRSWTTLFRVRVASGSVFVRKISLGLRGNFRALVGKDASLVWRR